MSISFKIISKNVDCVGKNIAQTKIKHSWVVQIEKQRHLVNLYESKLSHKYEVLINGKSIGKKKIPQFKDVEFCFEVAGLRLKIAASPSDKSFKLINTGEIVKSPQITKIKLPKKQLNSDCYPNMLSSSNNYTHDYPLSDYPVQDIKFHQNNKIPVEASPKSTFKKSIDYLPEKSNTDALSKNSEIYFSSDKNIASLNE